MIFTGTCPECGVNEQIIEKEFQAIEAERDAAIAEVERLKAQNIEIAIRFNCKDTEAKGLREALRDLREVERVAVHLLIENAGLGRSFKQALEQKRLSLWMVCINADAALATGGHDDNA